MGIREEKAILLIKQGDIISYPDMCKETGGITLQRGMNFRLRGNSSIILMSLRPGAPYADKVENEGKILIYEGHDIPKNNSNQNPKEVDQVASTPKGTLTQNGLFYEAALKYKNGKSNPELVKVYEKIRSGIWVYNGLFKLTDAWTEKLTLEMFSSSNSNSPTKIRHF